MSGCEKIVQYLYNELSMGEKAAFESHLEICGECRSELADCKKVVGRLNNLPSYEPPKLIITRRSYGQIIFRWGAVAAGFVCLALIMHLYISNPKLTVMDSVKLEELNNIEAEIAEINDRTEVFLWNLSSSPAQSMDNSVDEINNKIKELDKEIEADLVGF
ncbi:MAG: zf-HC2 domain-containing protein [Candidatus Brocadiia bacterium]